MYYIRIYIPCMYTHIYTQKERISMCVFLIDYHCNHQNKQYKLNIN